MKILCFNSSPRKNKGKTDIILDKFIEGVKDAGKEVVEKNKVTDRTQENLYKDFIMPKFLFRFVANYFMKKQMKV